MSKNSYVRNYCTYHKSSTNSISLTKTQLKDMDNIKDYLNSYKKLNWIISHLENVNSSLLDGKKFIIKNFKLHNIETMSKDKQKLINGVVTSIKHSPLFTGSFSSADIDYLSFLYKDSLETIDPLTFRVSFRRDLSDAIGQSEFFFPVSDKNFINNVPLALTDISIDRLYKKTPVSGLVYVHELAHTQTERIPEAYSNINNQEVISLLLELIYSYHFTKCYDFAKWDQIDMAQQMLYNKQTWNKKRGYNLPNSIYLNSIMYALDLFYTYRGSIDIIKQEMLKDIQNIFDGDSSVEDFIQKYSSPLQEVDCNRILVNLKK